MLGLNNLTWYEISDTEEQAVMLLNNPTIQNIEEDSFIVSEPKTSSVET